MGILCPPTDRPPTELEFWAAVEQLYQRICRRLGAPTRPVYTTRARREDHQTKASEHVNRTGAVHYTLLALAESRSYASIAFRDADHFIAWFCGCVRKHAATAGGVSWGEIAVPPPGEELSRASAAREARAPASSSWDEEQHVGGDWEALKRPRRNRRPRLIECPRCNPRAVVLAFTIETPIGPRRVTAVRTRRPQVTGWRRPVGYHPARPTTPPFVCPRCGLGFVEGGVTADGMAVTRPRRKAQRRPLMDVVGLRALAFPPLAHAVPAAALSSTPDVVLQRLGVPFRASSDDVIGVLHHLDSASLGRMLRAHKVAAEVDEQDARVGLADHIGAHDGNELTDLRLLKARIEARILFPEDTDPAFVRERACRVFPASGPGPPCRVFRRWSGW